MYFLWCIQWCSNRCAVFLRPEIGKGSKRSSVPKKLIKFLQGLEETSKEERAGFVSKLEEDGQTEYFGETILLILDRIDDSEKSTIVGRILAAHISGKIQSFVKTKRLIAIINRAYTADLSYLASFQPGVQKDHDVAASLSAAGLLENIGIDGGNVEPGSGGYIYDLNTYGRLLVTHCLK
jgi:hypothetical protein